MIPRISVPSIPWLGSSFNKNKIHITRDPYVGVESAVSCQCLGDEDGSIAIFHIAPRRDVERPSEVDFNNSSGESIIYFDVIL